MLGTREPDVYGVNNFEEYLNFLKSSFPSFVLEYFQSNIEGELIDKLHEVGFLMMELYLMPVVILILQFQ